MANLKELRGRISSVKNTRKITSAMSRIAAARLRKAQNAVWAARPYGERLQQVVDHLVAHTDPSDPDTAHPLLRQRPIERVAVLVMTADRGLCGGFNTNVNRATARFLAEQRNQERQVVVTTIGKKGRSFLTHGGQAIERSHAAPELDTLISLSKAIAAEAIEMFAPEGGDSELPQVDAVYLIHNHFVNVLSQQVVTRQVLPVPRPERDPAKLGPEPAFEPGRPELLGHLLPVAVESTIQQAMFDSIAAEVAARRMAMDSATDNATQLIGELTLEYNRERQAAITKELMEIIGGAEALKG